ncbi:MAG: CatA-like O-acetyltransferase [Gemmatimonadaceae bacterium]
MTENPADAVRSPGHFIDIAGWKRREHFALYRTFSSPFFGVSVELDVTPLRERCNRPDGPLFSLSAIFLALRCANETEAFRRRIRGDGVWVHDQIAISPTVLRSDETFAFARLDPADSFADFLRLNSVELRRARQPGALVAGHSDDDVIYHSTLPWVRFTGVSNAMPGGDDSIPRIVFGKCSKVGEGWRLPVGVEVHHAVADGIDVGRYLERLERSLMAGDDPVGGGPA